MLGRLPFAPLLPDAGAARTVTQAIIVSLTMARACASLLPHVIELAPDRIGTEAARQLCAFLPQIARRSSPAKQCHDRRESRGAPIPTSVFLNRLLCMSRQHGPGPLKLHAIRLTALRYTCIVSRYAGLLQTQGETKMKHINWAAGLALAVAATGSVSFADTLKVSSYLPPNHNFNHALELWSQELSDLTGGSLSLEVFPAGQLGPPPRQFDLVTTGAADMAIILHSSTPGRFPMSELAGLPLQSPSAGDASEISSRRLTELAPEFLADEHPGTRIMWMAVTPPLKLHFRNHRPDTVDGLSGLRMRYAGVIWQQILESVGAAPMPVQPGDTADAMSKGVIDGAAFPFEATQSFDLAPVSEYSMEPGLASATFALVLSQEAYDRLTPEEQAAIDATTGPDRAAWFGAMWDEGEAAGRQYMLDGGVEIVHLPDDQLDIMRERITPIVQAAIDEVGGRAQDFVDAYTQ